MKSHLMQTVILCGASCVLVTAKPVMAQSDNVETNNIKADISNIKTVNSNIETVTVIGTRQAYQGEFTALETPQADLKINIETLKDAGAFDLVQALDLSASVARQNNFGGLWNSFAVRGFVGDGNLPSNYLVNGFNAGRGFGGPRDLSGIESVEVLKGPRAALFGRGEPGGAINLVTKKPTFETEGDLTVSVGSFNTYRADADYTTPLTDDVAIRLVGFYEDAESFRDTIETKKRGFFPSITWAVTDQSQLSYEIEYSDQEIPQDRGVVAVGLEGEDKSLGVLPESRFLGEPGDGPIELNVTGHQLEFQHNFNENWSALAGINYRDTSLEGFATENGFYGGRQFLQFDGQNLTRFRRFRDYDAKYQVFRAEIMGDFETSGIKHRVIVGVDSDKFENDQLLLRARGSSIDRSEPIEDQLESLRVPNQVINIFNPVYGSYPLPDPGPNTDRIETQESMGFYIQDQISLTDKLDIRVGARFDDYEQELINRRVAVGADGRVSRYSETRVSPQFGVVYQTSDALSFYATYGENFRPLSGADDDDNLDPNISESTEAGLKFALNDGALEGNVAIFKVEQSNISTATPEGSTGIGGAQSQGVEVDINGEIANGLTLWVSYAYVDAKTTEEFEDVDGFGDIQAGSSLLNIPENQLSLQLVKQTQLAGKDLDLIGGLLYVGERNGFLSNQDFILPSYTTVRFATKYQVTESIAFRGEVNNLFDEEHYTNSYADVWVQPGAPRNYRLSATLSF